MKDVKELFEAGLINDAEYTEEKKAILVKYGSAAGILAEPDSISVCDGDLHSASRCGSQSSNKPLEESPGIRRPQPLQPL